MNSLNQIDLGATILSIALAAGFVAFGILVIRILINGITRIFKNSQIIKSSSEKTSK